MTNTETLAKAIQKVSIEVYLKDPYKLPAGAHVATDINCPLCFSDLYANTESVIKGAFPVWCVNQDCDYRTLLKPAPRLHPAKRYPRSARLKRLVW